MIKPTPMPKKPAPTSKKPIPMPKKPGTPIMLPKTAPTSKQDFMMDMAKKKFAEKPMGMAKGGMTKAKGMAKKGKK